MEEYPKFTDAFTFVWFLENLDISIGDIGYRIRSPIFSVETTTLTSWRIEFESTWGRDQRISMHLKRFKARHEEDPEEVPMTFRFIIVEPTIGFSKQSYWNIRYFKPDMSVEVDDFDPKECPTDLFWSVDLPLMVVCQMKAFDEAIPTTPVYRSSMDFNTLAEDMKKLYASYSFHDLVIKDGIRECKIHRCILAVRVPNFLEAQNAALPLIDPLPIVRSALEEVSGLMDPYLLFVYSEKFNVQGGYEFRKLLTVLEEYKLLSLEEGVSVFGNGCIVRTPNNGKVFFDWHLRPGDTKVHVEKQIPVYLKPNARFWMTCDIVTSRGCVIFDISARVQGLDGNPLFVRCVIRKADYPKAIPIREENVFVEDNAVWQIADMTLNVTPSRGPKSKFAKGLKLKVEIDFRKSAVYDSDDLDDPSDSNSDADSSRDNDENPGPRDQDIPSLVFDIPLSKLRRNLMYLYRNKLFTDLVLACDGENVFHAHKAILSARSDFFAEKLALEDASVIMIGRIEPQSMEYLLTYVYSASLPEIQCDDAMDLHRIAKEFRVHGLRRKCANFLQTCVNRETACQLLVFAHVNKEKHLKAFIMSYIRTNYDFFKNSIQFRGMARTRFDLVTTIIRDVVQLKLDNSG